MKIICYVAAMVCIVCICLTFCVSGHGSEIEACRNFLDGYGWQTEGKVYDTAAVNIPAEFDDVYKNYNIIQQEAGLDLLPCRGKSGVRYTFTVINYPIDAGEPVYANVICIDGVPVAGDIMTVSINGFMHSLNRRSIEDS